MTDNPLAPGTALASDERQIVIDAEHAAVRWLVLLLTGGLVVLVHLVGTALVRRMAVGVSSECIVLPLDVVALVAGGLTIESVLKRLIPSRRSATLSDQALVVRDERHHPPHITRIAWDKMVNVKAWRFTVSRRARVQKGWYCMAVYLLQDDEEVVFYAFLPPHEAETILHDHQFARLRPRQEIKSSTDLNTVAEQRRLLKLEDARWNDGAEISKEDFKALLESLRQHVPSWR
jgi:hypothetical protein